MSGNIDCMKVFLSNGANINAVTIVNLLFERYLVEVLHDLFKFIKGNETPIMKAA